jgi:hypothetical protein
MFTSLLLAAAISASSVGSPTDNTLPADVSSKIGLYLLVSTACDQMVGSDAGPIAKSRSTSILRDYGYSIAQVDSMLKRFVGEYLEYYISSVTEASANSDAAVRYFCSSAIKQKRKAVEEIEHYNQP